MKEPTTSSPGFIPAQINPYEKILTALHAARTCGTCGDLDKHRGTLDGYKYYNRYQRYTKPSHVGC